MIRKSLIFSSCKLASYVTATIALVAVTGAVQADEIVKIGSVEPLTGSIAHLGKDNENGAQLVS